MERLTDEHGCMTECDSCPVRSDCDGVCAEVDRVLDRIKEYEELGLTPEEIRQIDRLYREKCEELARYKAAIAEARKAQQEESKLYLDSYNDGWKGTLEFIEGAIEEASE